jgi:hypothetical protein
MPTHYHIYKNDFAGGPVDFGAVYATASASPAALPALPAPCDATFAVRAFDTVTGLEDGNTDCRVRIVRSASGADVTGRPNAPGHLRAFAEGGKVVVRWSYAPGGQGGGMPGHGDEPPGTGGAPATFKVWATVGAVVDHAATPAAVVPYRRRVHVFEAALTLAPATTYAIGVRASNAVADEPNTVAVSLTTPAATGPAAVDELSGAAAPAAA